MPIQNGEYVAPQWTNNAPPPLNASELQAICDTVESNQDKYTKEETVTDETKESVGLFDTSTPNDVFQYLINTIKLISQDSALVTVTVKDTS